MSLSRSSSGMQSPSASAAAISISSVMTCMKPVECEPVAALAAAKFICTGTGAGKLAYQNCEGTECRKSMKRRVYPCSSKVSAQRQTREDVQVICCTQEHCPQVALLVLHNIYCLKSVQLTSTDRSSLPARKCIRITFLGPKGSSYECRRLTL